MQCSPNVQLSATHVKLNVTPPLPENSRGIVTFENQFESFQQPFTEAHEPSFFRAGNSFPVTISSYEDQTHHIAKGVLTLPARQGDIFIDYKHLNQEAAFDIYIVAPNTSSQSKVKLDLLARQVVQLFEEKQEQAGPKISWASNVPEAIRKHLDVPRDYNVTLGVPPLDIQAAFVVVSRFIGLSKIPINSKTVLAYVLVRIPHS